MHLFKNFFRLLKNNSTGVIIYAFIFVAMVIGVIVAAPALASETSGEAYATQTSVNITYVDYDDSDLSRGLIEYLSVNNEVTDVSDRSESSIQNLVFFGLSEYHLTIEEGFGNLCGHGRIVSLVDTHVEVVAVIAHGMIRALHIAHVVVAEGDFISHQNEIEAVVQATAREAFLGIGTGGLCVVRGKLAIVVPFAHTITAYWVHETDTGVAIGLGEQAVARLAGTVHIEVAHNQHIVGGIVLVDMVHGHLHQGATIGLIAHTRLGVRHDTNEFDGVAGSQVGGLQIKLVDIGITRLGAYGHMFL